ncbi:MAG: hypothetical protein JWP89_5516 [Schlesneria sp.]|nr:hypothetical protein [Schlesneria sp.]
MMNTALLLAQDDGNNAAGGIGAMIFLVLYLAFIIFAIAGVWKTFEKAGKPGWAAIVPIYNMIVGLEIAGKPIWWILLLFIPCVNIIVAILVCIAFAKAFGKSEVFGIGLAFLWFIFFPILGFGDAKYIGAPRS